MIQYICRDMAQTVRYLPYGLMVGIPVTAVALLVINGRRKQMKKPSLRWFPAVLFGVYLTVLLAITFLSRENGSRNVVMDWKLFSTWGINDRNNAFVIENVLLFIPYGFLCGWNFDWAKNGLKCTLFGAVTSLGIECLQLVTGRGYFQIDDILTNILGTVLGWLVFWLLSVICNPSASRGD